MTGLLSDLANQQVWLFAAAVGVFAIAGGFGWLATHEDITEQRLAELQRSSMAELESRRAMIEDAIEGFRQRVESVLDVVSDDAGSMQVTASSLFGSSDQTSQRAQRAVEA